MPLMPCLSSSRNWYKVKSTKLGTGSTLNSFKARSGRHTQKHLSVIEELVKIHSKENDLVFDPFAGSATTALACKNVNRNFIGCEINKEYYDKAVKRL